MSIRYRDHVIWVTSPDPSSWAAAVLLDRLLRPKPRGYKVWLRFRKRWVRKQKMVCHYCHRRDLVRNSFHTGNCRQATIDHVIPKSKGGPEWDAANFVVSCSPCNQKKKDNLY